MSLFQYRIGKNYSNYENTSFIPLFLEDFNTTELADAQQVCGSNNDACMFDYLATQSQDIAVTTKADDIAAFVSYELSR